MDTDKAKHYFEIAAMKGHMFSRYTLGIMENDDCNIMKAAKHWIIAAEAGSDESLKSLKECFLHGILSKEDYAKALRAHKESKDEMESAERRAFSAALAKGHVKC